MDTTVLRLGTADRLVTDLTVQIRNFCAPRGSGLCHVFVPHSTAGLAVIETGSGSEGDLADLCARLLPRDDRYRHRHGSLGHGADHLVPAIFSPSLVLAVLNGEVELGTWQSVVLVDTNRDNPQRQVRLSFLSDR
jgi:secondary thiamine-phosphate synthase enzyme